MDWKIGEIRQVNGEWYQCLKSKGACSGCIAFGKNYSFCRSFGECTGDTIFKKLEKVGEPYVGNNGTFQSYKLAMPIYGDIPDQIIGFTTTEVVIKQNKEDMEENKLNLKPFDIQKAREGKPVCTRDGRKARIICFDKKKDIYPLIALVTDKDGYEIITPYKADGAHPTIPNDDLMMLPEKKEGWVNVYNDSLIYDTKEEALNRRSEFRGYIDTVKVSWEE